MEINTEIFTLEKLNTVKIESYDAFYLGDPFAPPYPGNLCQDFEGLRTAIHKLKEAGKRVYVSTFAVPRDRDMPDIENLLRFVKRENLPVDAIEAHNTGVLMLIREILPQIPVHMGCLSNIYTDSTVNLLKESGVTRVAPSYELTLDELEIIKDRCHVEVEILLHGRMALGVSEECPAVWWYNQEGIKEENETDLTKLCTGIVDLSSERMDLTVRGRTTLSGKDVCLMEHVPLLLSKGFRHFRIDTSVGSDEYFTAAGAAYRKALELWKEEPGKEIGETLKSLMAGLKMYSRHGFCNGYLFGRSGSEYLSETEGGREVLPQRH